MRRSDTLNRGFVAPGSAAAGPLEPPAALQRLASLADVAFNGAHPWDIRVHDPALYGRVLRGGSLGFGEAYMDGLWDSDQLDETLARLIRADVEHRMRGIAGLRMAGSWIRDWVQNRQSPRRAFRVGEHHYDIGNEVFRAMLDPTMSYSCGYWKDADSLEAAQRAKLDMVCRKLELVPGERLLDIGCGWGGLAEHAARRYGVDVLGITVSREQQDLALERCRGLPVTIRLQDYRDIDGSFDKIASVGMFEHVGPKNYRTFFRTVARVLADDGLMLLHTIGARISHAGNDPWIDKYIFPNGVVPSARQITTAFEPWFVLEDWHNFGPDYERTLMAWWDNFSAAWPSLDRRRYDQRFYRMWKYYLHASAGYFRARDGQLWQIVLSKPTRSKLYRSMR
jgi:cyclopropane-fatty-acyl-phospholipid synthase